MRIHILMAFIIVSCLHAEISFQDFQPTDDKQHAKVDYDDLVKKFLDVYLNDQVQETHDELRKKIGRDCKQNQLEVFNEFAQELTPEQAQFVSTILYLSRGLLEQFSSAMHHAIEKDEQVHDNDMQLLKWKVNYFMTLLTPALHAFEKHKGELQEEHFHLGHEIKNVIDWCIPIVDKMHQTAKKKTKTE